MLDQINLKDVLFLDVETVPQVSDYKHLNPELKKLWDLKAKWLVDEGQTAEDVFDRAGIYAEFGKVICVSVGFVYEDTNKREFRIKSFFGDNEKGILEDLSGLLNKHYNEPHYLLCAHNGKEFDFPYLCRRMVINGITIPYILELSGKRPWEVNHLDTMHLWRFGDYKHYTSLKLLATIFDIPTPKDDIEGKDVARVYYEEKNLARIVNYCQKDTLTVAQIMLKYKGERLLENDEIVNV